MGLMTRGMLSASGALARQRAQGTNPRIAKNSILRDRVNDEQARLAKQGPALVRNPKKVQKGV